MHSNSNSSGGNATPLQQILFAILIDSDSLLLKVMVTKHQSQLSPLLNPMNTHALAASATKATASQILPAPCPAQ